MLKDWKIKLNLNTKTHLMDINFEINKLELLDF